MRRIDYHLCFMNVAILLAAAIAVIAAPLGAQTPIRPVPSGTERAPAARAPIERAPIEIGALRIEFGYDETNQLESESFELPELVPPALGDLAIGDRRLARGFPVAPGEREDVLFERIDVVAPGAKVFVHDTDGVHEIPQSARVQLLGIGVSNSAIRVGLSMDPSGESMRGLLSHPTGVFELSQTRASSTSIAARPAYLVIRGSAVTAGMDITTTCDTPDEPVFFDPDLPAWVSHEVSVSSAAGPPTHSAVVAFDTDAEFVNDPVNYNGNTTNANNAITDLVTSMNVLYERDFQLRLLKGTTILRTVVGPYTATTTGGQLTELGNEWFTNQGAVARVFATLLSGKGFYDPMGGCSASGLATLDRYCDNNPAGGGSYSVNQVLRCPFTPLNGPGNTNLIGHEIGHNAGSPHTHCYVPTIDFCYKAEGGCYAGAVSCPDFSGVIAGIAVGKGTAMSYCNFSGPNGAACGQTEPFFHPTVSALVTTRIAANTNPACVQTLGGGGACPMGVLDMVTVNTVQAASTTIQACTKITAAAGFGINAGVAVTLQSGGTIEFMPGSSAAGILNAKIGFP